MSALRTSALDRPNQAMEELSLMDTQPTVGTWYENDVGDNFVVVAVHPERGTLEIGTLNGTVDEMDLEAWSGMAPREIEPPEGWHGSSDGFSPDGAGAT